MRSLRTYVRAVTRLNEWVGVLTSYLILPVFGLLMLEVILRYVFGAPEIWTGELAQMLFGVYGVLAGGYLMAHGAHANVDILYMHFNRRARARLDVFTSIMFFLFAGALLYFGASLALESLEELEHSQSAWNPPVYPVKLCIPIGVALLLLQGIAKLIEDLYAAFGGSLFGDGGEEAGGGAPTEHRP